MSDTVAKDSMVLMIGRALVLMISVITPIILVRIFSVGEFGEYRQAMLIVTSAACILPLGMPQSLYYFFPHYPADRSIYLARTIAIMALTGMVFCSLMWLRAPDVAAFFRNDSYLQTSAIIGLSAFMFGFSSLIDTALLADGEVMLSTRIMTIARIIQAPVLIGCALAGGFPLLLKGFLLVLTGKSLYSIWFFRRAYRMSFFRLELQHIMPHLKYGVPLGIGVLFSMLSETADKFIVSHCTSDKLFAIYSAGCYELPFIIVIFGSIGDVVLPVIVKLKSMDLTGEVVKTWHKAIEHSMLIGIPVTIFFCAYADEFITTVFTMKYADAVPIFRVSILSILLESTRYGMITRAYARTGFMLFVAMAAFLLMLPATYYGIRYFGLIGAIGAFIATRFLIVGSEIIYSKYILSLAWRDLLPFRYMFKITAISCCCLLLPLLSTRLFVFGNNWAQLFYLMAFTFASYAYVTNYLGYWSADVLPIPGRIKRILIAVFSGRQSDCWISA